MSEQTHFSGVLSLPPLTGLKIRTKIRDCNEVEGRGEVNIPIGHTAVIGERIVGMTGEFYAVLWDDDAEGPEGLDMGWCIWSRSELFAKAEFIDTKEAE